MTQVEQTIQTILVVEDDEQLQMMLSDFLKGEGYAVTVANNGREGIESFRAGHPDLVITDIVMPEIEGVEMIQQIRAIDPDMPIIAISGGSSRFSDDYLSYVGKLGANEQLAKPFELDELLEVVKKYLFFN